MSKTARVNKRHPQGFGKGARLTRQGTRVRFQFTKAARAAKELESQPLLVDELIDELTLELEATNFSVLRKEREADYEQE
jgi:hypothetical protein